MTTSTEPKKINLLCAMPCYQASVNVECAKKVSDLRLLLLSKGIGFEWFTLGSESLISRGRNACIAYYLSKPEFTHLLFIDADIVFDPNVVLVLLDKDADVSGCPYPRKCYQPETMFKSALNTVNWDTLKQDITAGKSKQEIIKHQLEVVGAGVNMMFARQSEFVYTLASPNIQVENGWLAVREIGTGFMMIKKEAILKLIEKHPEMKYTNDVLGYNQLSPNMKDNFYLFFDCRVEGEGENRRYLSEDYAACKLFREAGYQIQLYTNTTLYHVGNHSFVGNLFTTLYLAVEDQK